MSMLAKLDGPEFLQFSELRKRLHEMRYNEKYTIVDPYFSVIECLVDVVNNLNHRVTELEKKVGQDDNE